MACERGTPQDESLGTTRSRKRGNCRVEFTVKESLSVGDRVVGGSVGGSVVKGDGPYKHIQWNKQ